MPIRIRMSRIYIYLLGSTALCISSIGALFSIIGLTHLFAGAPISVGLLAGSLEAAKLVVAGFLYRYWGHVNVLMRSYLCAAVVLLSGITSLGVFGYLTHAYQKSSQSYKVQQLKISQLRGEQEMTLEQIAKVEEFINTIPKNRISKKFEIYEKSRKQVANLTKKSEEILNQIHEVEMEGFSTQAEIGPLIDVSQAFGVSVDKIAKILILIFVSVFDPLAICLVFAWSLAVRLREKYRGNEAKIAELSVSKPVDHRYKKAA